MKKVLHTITPMLNQVHTYPFWIFLGFLYASIGAFAMCALVMWFPAGFGLSGGHRLVGEALFETGMGLFTVGGITAPMMDLILHFDIDRKG